MAGGGVDTAVISTADRAKFQRDGCTTMTTATTTTAITIVATTTVATASVPLCTNVLAYAIQLHFIPQGHTVAQST